MMSRSGSLPIDRLPIAGRGADMRLLIIDDDAVFTRTLARALERLGHAATVAHDPASAMSHARQQCFEAAIVDLRLAEHSGLALIGPLTDAAPDMRILMLTGYASIATAIQAIKKGADNYLPKPASAREILAALATDADETGGDEGGDHRPTSWRRLEWEHIQQVLADHDHNISATARALNMHRRTLQRKLAKRPVSE